MLFPIVISKFFNMKDLTFYAFLVKKKGRNKNPFITNIFLDHSHPI